LNSVLKSHPVHKLVCIQADTASLLYKWSLPQRLIGAKSTHPRRAITSRVNHFGVNERCGQPALPLLSAAERRDEPETGNAVARQHAHVRLKGGHPVLGRNEKIVNSKILQDKFKLVRLTSLPQASRQAKRGSPSHWTTLHLLNGIAFKLLVASVRE